MNTTFKVVFNKARGALMVVNEITSSVQSKGTKTVIATAVAAMIAGIAGVANAETVAASDNNVIVSKNITVGGQAIVVGTTDGTEQNKVDVNIAKTDFTIGSADKALVINGAEDDRAFKVYQKGYTNALLGKTITITGKNRAVNTTGSTLTIGGDNTESITLATKNAAKSEGTAMFFAGSQVTMKAARIDITSDTTFTLHTQNSTQKPTAPTGYTNVKLIADNINITNTLSDPNTEGLGISAFSNSKLSITGNLTVNATHAIDTRGNSTIELNTDGKHFTKLNGDIVFETPSEKPDGQSYNSGEKINSYVTVGLHGAESSWTGRAYQNFKLKKDDKWVPQVCVAVDNGQAETYGPVTGFTLDIAKGGTWNVTGDSFVNTLKLSDGGIVSGGSSVKEINVGTFTVKGADNKLTLAKDTKLGGTITFVDADSSLITNFDTAYTLTTDKDTKAVTKAEAKLTVDAKDGGTLVMNDEFVYTPDGLASMSNVYTAKNPKLLVSLKNGKAYLKEGESVKLTPGIVNEKENVVAPIEVTDKGGATIDTNGGAATVKIEDTNTDAPKLVTDVSVKGNLTLVGTATDDHLVQNANGASVDTLTVQTGATLNLGSPNQEAETSGKLPDLVVEGGTVNVENITSTVNSLVAKTNSTINVGTPAMRGAMKLGKLDLQAGSTLFLDPAWKDSAELDVIGNASHLQISDASGSTIAGNLVVGQNSLVTFGGTVEQASAGLDALNLKWGKDNVTAALYLGSKLPVTGSVLVDGSLTAVPTTLPATGTVELKDNSLLLINQAGVGDQAIEGKLKVTDKAQVGILNATDGSIKLANAVTGGTPVVLTDNQFVNGTYAAGVVKTSVDTKKLAGAVASMGVQQMTRRADTVFANTIADRTMMTIPGEGVALWVDVGGERYEADDLDNGAQYKANMFYGAFGADVGVTPDARIGAAIQYGSGDSKSDNYGIKNDIDAVTFGLYGSYNVTDAAKIVGEFGWTHTTNDVTASERLLANDFDADMFSLGIRGQHEFKVGVMKIIPSVGLRVSRISTDSFHVGGVKVDVDDQTIVQVPLSVAFAANDIDANGWKLNPYAKVSFTPTFGDDEINVRGYKQTALDTMPVQGNFGLSATNGNVSFGAALSAGFGQDGAKNFGGKVGVKYVF